MQLKIKIKPIVTICASRRHSQAMRMLESFNRTSTQSDLYFLVDLDDPNFQKYPANQTFVQPRTTVTDRMNAFYRIAPTYQFYHLTNDDVIYKTPDWDKKFISASQELGEGIFYGNDLYQGESMPTFPCISHKIIESVGWVQMPRLNRYYGDMVWKFIGNECNCLYYIPEIEIEHMHHLAGKGNDTHDDTVYTQDKIAFGQWLPYAYKDIDKVVLAL